MQFLPYKNIMPLQYKDRSVSAAQGSNGCSHGPKQHINALCGQCAETLVVTEGGAYAS
jgi:hypothetical protein